MNIFHYFSHFILNIRHSLRRASIGRTLAAFRAGARPAMVPAMTSRIVAPKQTFRPTVGSLKTVCWKSPKSITIFPEI